MTERQSFLTKGLAVRLRHCLANPGPGHKKQWDLRDGLTIVLYVDGGDRRHVLLSRRGEAAPSAQEAATVLEHWPEPIDTHVEWVGPTQQGKFWVLLAMWPAPAVQLELGVEGKINA